MSSTVRNLRGPATSPASFYTHRTLALRSGCWMFIPNGSMSLNTTSFIHLGRKIPFSLNHKRLFGFERWGIVLRNVEINIGGFAECPMVNEQWRTVKNKRRTVLQVCHFSCTMLRFRSMTVSNPMSKIIFAVSSIALHQPHGVWCRLLLLC